MDRGELINEVTPVDTAIQPGEPEPESDSTSEGRMDAPPVSEGTRAAIVAKLPESWSESEVDHFIATYYGKLSEEIGDAKAIAEATQPVEEEVEVSGPPTSLRSKRGLTLDTYIIIDGRSITLRACAESGALVPMRTLITEGNRKFPRQAVLYVARLIDRYRMFDITEETYKVLSSAYPQEHPVDEPLSAEAVRNIQAPVTVVKADNLDGTKPR
jgi:hypothetical protein